MADKTAEGAERTDVEVKNVGRPNPASFERLAEDLPERDEIEKAYKAQMQADTAQKEAREKVKIVDGSPGSDETPSGYALKKVAGISSDEKRGEAYSRKKTAKRWGYVPVDE